MLIIMGRSIILPGLPGLLMQAPMARPEDKLETGKANGYMQLLTGN